MSGANVVRIITIDREYGSGGGVIAEKIARRLNWKLAPIEQLHLTVL